MKPTKLSISRATWNDLSRRNQQGLREMIQNKKSNSNVITVFAGQDSKSKIAAARVMAKELKLNLFRIDLSAVVNKYIGETEKNLRQLFDAAEHTNAVLFFDEADALFGKRSKVKDSHDRYANMEISYLLLRIEDYPGVVILATNLKSAIDSAFVRRVKYTVEFPLPRRIKSKAVL